MDTALQVLLAQELGLDGELVLTVRQAPLQMSSAQVGHQTVHFGTTLGMRAVVCL